MGYFDSKDKNPSGNKVLNPPIINIGLSENRTLKCARNEECISAMSMQAEIGKHNDVSIQFYNLSKVHHSQINKERVEGDIQFVAKIFDDNSESRELVLLLRMWESKLLHSDSFETAKEVLEKHKESAKADTEKYGALINALETC